MNKEIHLKLETKQGQEILTPVGLDAELLCQLAGNSRMMSRPTLKLVKQLGYTISIEQPKHAFQEFV